jgi:hypothetical protein
MGLVLAVAVNGSWVPAVRAQASDQPRTTFGTLGLVEMPSARMEPDGTLSAGASYFQDTQRYYVNFQALPWLETSLRYSGLRNFEPALPDFFPVYWDRSFAVKARLFQESSWFPEVSVGIDDLIGTGVYSGEYLVASKRLGAFDATLGLGWGRLAGSAAFSNPFGALFHSFKTRSGLAIAGGTDFNVLFHGPNTGVFGGLVWHTPIDGLSLITEYSSDNYQLETKLGLPRPKSQINYGLSYQVSDSLSVNLNWLYGHMIGGSIAVQTDPTTPQYPVKIAPDLPLPHIRSDEQQRQALNLLLDQRNGGAPTTALSKLDRGHFVDRLFQTATYDDVEIRGQTLLLTADRSGEGCAELAPLVASFDGKIHDIVLNQGRRQERCAVPPLAVAERLAPASAAVNEEAIRAIKADAEKQDIGIEAIRLTGSQAIVYYVNRRYFAEDDALNRLILVLMQDAPPDVEQFRLHAMGQQEFDVLRAPMERAFSQQDSAELVGNAITMNRPALDNPVLAAADRQSFPRFSWSAYPQLRESFFDPKNPLALQLIGAAEASLELRRGLSLNGEVEANIFQNLPDRPSNSLLPHVRTDLPRYIHEGGTGIGLLDLDYQFRLSPDLFAAVRAGYLESMFAAAGGEVLWWPEASRWAIGADLYEAQKRNFDRLFGLQSYRVATGHVTVYYQSPWYDLNFQLRAGRYLAGDKGVTFQVSRRFSTGVEIGAFFTKTNVSATQFGEGSFDKGIVIRIPLDWALPASTQSEFQLDLRPVQRDGGQTLGGDATLYGRLMRSSGGEVLRHADTLVRP